MFRRYRAPSALLAVLVLLAMQTPSLAQKYGETPGPVPSASSEAPAPPAAGDQSGVSGGEPLHRLGLIRKAPSMPPAATAVLERVRQERARRIAAKAAPGEILTSPATYDNSAGLPPVGNQGNQGSCASWAVGYYYKTYQEGKEYGWSLTDTTHQFSPAFLYNQLQRDDTGSSFEGNFGILINGGGCSMATMPYSAADHLTWPTASAYREGIPHRAQSYEYLGDGQTTDVFAAVKAVVSSGDLCIVGIPIYRPTPTTAGRFDQLSPSNYEYDGPGPADKALAGYHALTIVGYDESKFSGAGGYKIVNSWGTWWGNSGFAWLSQGFLTNYAFGFYDMTDKIGYTPTAFVHYKVSHSSWSSDQIAITFGVGDTAGPFWSKLMDSGIPRDSLVMDRWADLTEGGYMPPSSASPWWIRVADNANGNAATLSVFDIEYASTTYSPGSPLPQDGPSGRGSLFVYIPSAPTGPVNDDFADRTTIDAAGGTAIGTNVGATKESGEPNHASNAGGKSVWWTWTPAVSGSTQIDTIGSGFDTTLGVYTGSSVSALTTVASDDDSGGSFTSRVTFTAAAGTTYQVAVDGYGGASGSIALHVIAPTIANDNFSGRIAISAAGGTATGANADATKEAGEPDHAGNSGGKSLWWTWTPTMSGSIQIDTIGSDFDTILGVYTGSSVSALTTIASDDDNGGSHTSRATFGAVAGTAYQIAVDGYNGVSGNITLNVSAPAVSVTVQSSPSGRFFTVDATTYASAQTFSWISGSSHTIAVTSPQSGGTGTQYVWNNWSDGGAMSHTVTPAADTTYTADFTSQYYLTMAMGTGGSSVAPASGWQTSSAVVEISATAAGGYTFGGWTGSGSGSYSGSSNPASVTMNGPITETAGFNAAAITVTSPNGGESWAKGTSHNVTWTSTLGGNVRIELFKGGVFQINISTSTANDGSYSWSVPSTVAAGTDYRVKISWPTTSPSVSDSSDGDFTILPYISTSAPSSGRVWQRGTTQSIVWSSNAGGNVKIELYKGTVLDSEITPSTSNSVIGTNSYSWPIPPTQAMATTYKVKVTSLADGTTSSTTGAFSITGAGTYVTVTSPNGGEYWQKGSVYTVTWSSDCEDNVKIELYKAGRSVSTLASSRPNTGSFPWTISSTQTPGSDYQVKVSCVSNSALKDQSDANFTISARLVTLTTLTATPSAARPSQSVTLSPVGGAYQAGVPGETTRIVMGLRDSGGHWVGGEPVVAFTAVTADLLSHPWTGSATITAPGTTGSYYFWAMNAATIDSTAAAAAFKAAVPSTSTPGHSKWATALVVATPYIRLSVPASGAVWQRGTTRTITWTSNAGGNVKIELFKSGSLNSTITTSTANTGSFPWPIPASQTMSSSYTIKITSLSDGVTSGTSSTFSITGAGTYVTVTSPNGGEIWQVGNTYSVTWASDSEDGVKVELYKAGRLNRTLISFTANTGTYSWPISTSQTLGSDYTVKVSCASNSGLNDLSNVNFSITMRGVTISALSMTPTTVRPGQGVTVNALSGTYQAATPTETTRIVLGLRDTSGYWAGGEPVVVFTATPGDTVSHPWTGSVPVTISAPTKTGSLYLWALNSAAADDAAAIADFKARKVTSSVTPSNKWPATLTVSGAVIAVTYPNGAQTWTTGSSYTITWTSYVGGNVNVDLYKSSTKVLTIGAGVPNSGSCPWTVPVGYTLSTSYKVKVTSTTSTSWYDYSDAYFAIAAGPSTPQVLEPTVVSVSTETGEPLAGEALSKITAAAAATSGNTSASGTLIDGDASTSWQTVGTTLAERESVTLDAGVIGRLAAVGLAPGSDMALFPTEFTIEVSTDGQTWAPVTYAKDFHAEGPSLWRFEAIDARYVRVSGPGVANAADGRYYWQVGEIVVHRIAAR